MNHTDNCLKRQEELARFRELWSDYCRKCGAYGAISYPERRYSDGSGEPGGSDPCTCVESGVCPRCGDNNLNFLTRGSFEWGYCHKCGWDEHAIANTYGEWKEMIAPNDGECDCWWEANQEDELELEREIEELENELLEIMEELGALDYPKEEIEEWSSDPVRCEDDQWWFYDELWVDRFGPFEFESVARSELAAYINHLDGHNFYWSGSYDELIYPVETEFFTWRWFRDNSGTILFRVN